mgnify:CR=1 FL=1
MQLRSNFFLSTVLHILSVNKNDESARIRSSNGAQFNTGSKLNAASSIDAADYIDAETVDQAEAIDQEAISAAVSVV